MDNITKCQHCQAYLIFEEIPNHKCYTINNSTIRYDSISNDLFLFDGKEWISWLPNWLKNFPPKNKHPFTTPKESTEPIFLISDTLLRQIMTNKE